MAERAQFTVAFEREVVFCFKPEIFPFLKIFIAVFLFPLLGTPATHSFYITKGCVLVFNHNFKKEKQVFESIFYPSLNIFEFQLTQLQGCSSKLGKCCFALI